MQKTKNKPIHVFYFIKIRIKHCFSVELIHFLLFSRIKFELYIFGGYAKGVTLIWGYAKGGTIQIRGYTSIKRLRISDLVNGRERESELVLVSFISWKFSVKLKLFFKVRCFV
jgi:hypothetical protein